MECQLVVKIAIESIAMEQELQSPQQSIPRLWLSFSSHVDTTLLGGPMGAAMISLRVWRGCREASTAVPADFVIADEGAKTFCEVCKLLGWREI
jgi:hypothetical protein